MIKIKKVTPPTPQAELVITLGYEFAKQLHKQLVDLPDTAFDPTRQLYMTMNEIFSNGRATAER